VDGELAEDGADDVGVEDVGLGALFREALDGLDEKIGSVLLAEGWGKGGRGDGYLCSGDG
jgi:hypothetical protein